MRHPAIALVLVAAALAAPRPAAAARCPLLGPGSALVAGNGLAIRSADLASNAREITAVVRVADLSDPGTSALHRSFAVYFSRDPERSYVLRADVNPVDGAWFHLERTDGVFDPGRGSGLGTGPRLGTARGVVDLARDEVRITLRLAAVPELTRALAPGGRVNYLGARTAAWVRVALPEGSPVPGWMAGQSADEVSGGRDLSYRLGSPGCVPVGR